MTVTFANLGIPPATRTYPPWRQVLIEKVDWALCMAWERVCQGYPHLIAGADEDLLTDQLKTELVALRKADTPAGFNCYVFGVPMRDAKARTGSGSSIDAMPDLTIHLAESRPDVEDDHDALYFECKVVAPKKGLSLYDKNGIQRFVDGWYASRMPHAGMVAYALDTNHTCPATSLAPYLRKKERTSGATNGERLRCTSGPIKKAMATPGMMVTDIAETVHGRLFPSQPHLNPSDISLRHLWLLPQSEKQQTQTSLSVDP